MATQKDWHEDTPTTDAEWLAYSDFWWHEIVQCCGLDTSFVGSYADGAAISYAKQWHAERCANMGYPRLVRAPYNLEVASHLKGKLRYRWVQGWTVQYRPGRESTGMRFHEARAEKLRASTERDYA